MEVPDRRGFTLVELMIVVAVMSVLTAIAIPKFADMVRKSREATIKGNLGAIRGALSIYYADMEGKYPSDDMSSLATNHKYLTTLPVANVSDYHALVNWNHLGGGNAFSDNGNWEYDNQPGDAKYGSVWVNCTHTDARGTIWTTY